MACVLTALIRMNQHLFFGITPPYSHQQCVQDNVLVIRDCMDQPIILRENRSTTTARYSQPSWVLMGYVRYPTLIRSIRIELSLEPVG